jgi:aminomuconate-semialdehyde/2-hydroxymuconate-6-semialdehyde dehydrogenase
MRQIKHFIAGEFTDAASGVRFNKHSPLDNSVICSVSEAGRGEVDAAVSAARNALQGEWGRLSTDQRVELLYSVANEITRRFDDFVEAEMSDTGQPEHVMKHVFIPRGAANFKVFADVIKNVARESFQMDTPDGRGAFNYGDAPAQGRDRGDLPVERCPSVDDLEGRPGPGLRQHRGGQAIGGITPARPPCWAR